MSSDGSSLWRSVDGSDTTLHPPPPMSEHHPFQQVLEALEVLKKKSDAQPEEIVPIEKLIADAYSAIDKAVVKGSLHKNTGANRKSRLARNKKAVEIHHGWYTPAAATTV